MNGNGDLTVRRCKDFFPHMVQSETLTTHALELYAASGGNLTRCSVDAPANLADDRRSILMQTLSTASLLREKMYAVIAEATPY